MSRYLAGRPSTARKSPWPIFIVVSLGILAGTVPAAGKASTIFSETYSGANLVEFPILTSRPISVSGTTLNVGTGGIFPERLIEIPVVSAGTLSSNQEVTASFSLNESPPSGSLSDHDIYVGITDGTFYTGFGRQDNSGWRGIVIHGDVGGAIPSLNQVLFTNAGFDPTFSGIFTTNGVDTFVSGSFGTGTDSIQSSLTIDPSRDLRMFILLDETDEQYAIDSFSVSVSAVPLPAAFWLFGSSVVGLLGLSSRSKF